MAFKKQKPTTPGRRFALFSDNRFLAKARPVKKLVKTLKKRGGRNAAGQVTIRHRGGGHKRLLRKVDFLRREKSNISAKVIALEYDPNRNAHLAHLLYQDGARAYILAPDGLRVGAEVMAGEKAELKVGHALPLARIPIGTVVHNVEIRPGKGGQVARGAGNGVVILGREEKWMILKLPSGERKRFLPECYATIGQVGNQEAKLRTLGKAGRRRRMGWRPSVRGVAMHPGSHPHGGGEGRSGIGMPSPKSPWGKKTLGKKTRKRKKYSDKLIISRKK
ncbi:MAG: 50S ribosomal protein L2 [Candidatus Pacebacteria bacterium]|nr:50S ribosomal protein L2 [Candidatus Paceibacterota bacterium]